MEVTLFNLEGAQKRHLKKDGEASIQIKAQRSGFDLERTSSGMSELWRLCRSEGYEACEDEKGLLERYFK